MASGPQPNAAEIDRLALALAKDPASKSFIPLAEEYGKSGMWAEAAGILEDGLKYYPGFITAMVALGRAYDQLGQPTKAKAILEEAVKISPDNLRAHRTLAKIYIAEGSSVAALHSCDVILALNPLDQESLSMRASLGAATPTAAATPRKPFIKSVPTPAPVTEITPSPSIASPAIADIPAPVPEIVATAPLGETTARDVIADATEMVTAALTNDPEQPSDLPPIEAPIEVQMTTPAPSEPVTMEASPPASSRRQGQTARLEHLLQSIHTRRRDRPSPQPTAPSS